MGNGSIRVGHDDLLLKTESSTRPIDCGRCIAIAGAGSPAHVLREEPAFHVTGLPPFLIL